jgi:two-component system, OmpR family, manganese sensing response regulator
MAKVLIVEDDPKLLKTLNTFLGIEDFEVTQAEDGKKALDLLENNFFDIVVLDWNLPERSGVDVLKAFRHMGGNTPVLMLTGNETIEHREEGLDAGADDYLTKPFHPKELTARLRALLRRPKAYMCTSSETAALSVDVSKQCAVRNGEEVSLSGQEFALLEFFIRNPSQVFSPEVLLDRVWPSSSDASSTSIRTHVKKLRQKLDREGQPSIIQNVHGVGYRFNAQ